MGVALKQETRTVPVVFNGVSDPIGYGLVASLARPGGNLTGFLLYEEGIVGKWLIDVVVRVPNGGLVVLPDSATATSSLISRHGIAYRQSMRFAFL